MIPRKPVLVLLCITMLAPIVLYTDKLGSFSISGSRSEFLEDSTTLAFGGDVSKLNAQTQERPNDLKEPMGIVYKDLDTFSHLNEVDSEKNGVGSVTEENRALEESSVVKKSGEYKSRVLSAAEDDQSEKDILIERVNEEVHEVHNSDEVAVMEEISDTTKKEQVMSEKQSAQVSASIQLQESHKTDEKLNTKAVSSDAYVRHLRDQLIQARVFLGLGPIRSNPNLLRELRLRLREVQRAVGDASKDSELPKNANEKMRAMDQTLAKAKQVQDDCAVVVKKLRAILHSTEDQLRAHKKQAMYLTQLAAKTLPKGLHCLPLRLSVEYYSLSPEHQQFPNQERLEDSSLYHYAIFSDNVLATAVVVNSTIVHAKEPMKHVFHIVTDRLNYAAMRMWFISNPPGKATVQVQNIEEFTWLNSSYSPVLKQLETPSMIDYYFRAHRANLDSNLKYRNPKYLSILNHLRFYLPEIFPKLDKVLFLDDDIVVQKDMTGLWSLDLKGKVNGAVETCGERFHRFDRYLNFSHPLISKNFDPHACGWAYGMNIFDLKEWRNQKITEIYHSWQKLNQDRTLWKLGTLPPGLITFWKRTHPLDKSWHVLGLGYNPNVNQKDIERAAVVHYNGNMKPWLEIGIPKYRRYWAKFVDYEQVYLRECNINP